MLITGTLADHAEQLAARLARPDHPSIPHLAAPAAALGFAQRGDTRAGTPDRLPLVRAAAAVVDLDAGRSPTGPRSPSRSASPTPAGSTTSSHRTRASWPSSAWAPTAAGAVDSLLAGLAWRLGRLDEATERARAGLALETRVGSQIWINRTTDLINRIGTAQGHAVSRDQVTAAALENTDPATRPAQLMIARDAFGLSARELEVARLVADGLSNPAIASALFISVATVKTHVSHMLAKLGLDSRVQLASWVAGHDPARPR